MSELEAAGRARRARRGGAARRRHRPLGARSLRGADRADGPARTAGRAPGGRSTPAAGEPVRCNATLVAGEPAAVGRGRPALGRRGLLHLQAQARGRRRRRPGAGRARGGRAGGADPGRCQRRLGRGRRPSGPLRELEHSTSSWPSSRWRRWRRRPSWRRRPRSRSPATRASRAAATPSARSRSAPAIWPGSSSPRSAAGGGDRDRRGAAVLRLQRPRRPGWDRGGGAGSADAARGSAGRQPRTSPTASRPSASSPRRRRGRVRAARRDAAPAPRPRPRRRDRRARRCDAHRL